MVNYIYKDYEEFFPQLFESEKKRLQTFLSRDYTIEHFGSISVPGLGGKGGIDIYIVVPEDKVEQTKNELEKAGYEFHPDSGTDERFIFVKDLPDTVQSTRRYNIHLTTIGSEDFKKCISFRDYLRDHPEDVLRYAEIKQKAAQEGNNKKEDYFNIKKPVIEEIQAKADLGS